MDLASKKLEVPEDIKRQWQRIMDMIAGILKVPAALIMRLDPPQIEVFRTSKTKGNPYRVVGINSSSCKFKSLKKLTFKLMRYFDRGFHFKAMIFAVELSLWYSNRQI